MKYSRKSVEFNAQYPLNHSSKTELTGGRFTSSRRCWCSKAIGANIVQIRGAAGARKCEGRHRDAPLQLLRCSGERESPAMTIVCGSDISRRGEEGQNKERERRNKKEAWRWVEGMETRRKASASGDRGMEWDNLMRIGCHWVVNLKPKLGGKWINQPKQKLIFTLCMRG